MSLIPRSIKSILILDALLYLFGLLGIYLLTIKADLPFQTAHNESTITSKDIVQDTMLSLSGKEITKIDGYEFSSPEETETYLDGFKKGDKVHLTFSNQSQIVVSLVNYYSMPYNILAFIIGSAFFAIAIIVLIKARLQKPARIFHWLSVFTALIIMATWGYYNLQPKVIGLAPRIILHLAVSIVPTLFLNFTLTFPAEKRSIKKYWVNLLYILSALIFLLLNYYFLSVVFNTTIENIKTYVMSYNISRIYLIVCVIAAVLVFIHSYKTSPGESDKKKLKWILYGLAIGPLGFILLWTLPIILTKESLLPEELILILVSVIPITFGISIVKYHVMDIDQIINRSVVYIFVLVVLLMVYLVIVGMLTNYAVQIEPRVSSIITALLIALLFQPIRNKVQTIIDKQFFRVQYNFREVLKKIFEEIQQSHDIKSLADKVINRIYELLPVDKIGFFVLDNKSNLKLTSHKNFDLLVNRSIKFQKENLRTDLSLPIALPETVESGVPIEIADLKVFQKWRMNLVFPIKSTDKTVHGFLVLGAKKSGVKFSIEDIDLLNAVAGRTAATIDRIKLQEELIIERVESERLDELNRMKSYFISSVSHDMKTPLTSIKILAELLQSSTEIKSEKAKEYLEIIEGETTRLTRLIDNVLEFSKIEKGIKEYRFENVNLNEIVRVTMKMMQYQLKLYKFQVDVLLSEDEKVIYADKDAVEEAIINLLSNSIKYSAENRFIKVSTLLENDFMILSVEDKGIGISKENVDNIFNPFFRIDSKEIQRSGGAGLGLSIVKHIMDAHKGKIEVQSELRKGSNFKLLFPVVNQ